MHQHGNSTFDSSNNWATSQTNLKILMENDMFNTKVIILCMAVLVFSASLGAQKTDWYTSTIMNPTPFLGINEETFKLADGSVWQVQHEYLYLYAYYPTVYVSPSLGKMVIDGKSLNVLLLSQRKTSAKLKKNEVTTIESKIDGSFEGWRGDTIVKLTNGQIWQQVSYYYWYRYSYMPKVYIFYSNNSYKMIVDGIDKPITVMQLK